MRGHAQRGSRAAFLALTLVAGVCAAPVLLRGQEFADHYRVAERAYQDYDLAKAEQEFLASLKSKDVPKSRGAGALLVSQQRGFFPEYYLVRIYCSQERYEEMKPYVEAAKQYIKVPDPKRFELESCENAAKKSHDESKRGAPISVGTPVAPPLPALDTGPMYALVIGIDHYEDKAFKALTTAERDARAVSDVLHDQYGFDTKLLLGANAKRHDIIAALDEYGRKADATSSLLIYFAGHGRYDKDNLASWMAYDAEDVVTAYWIKSAEITSEIHGIPARHVIVIADSCYSGGLTTRDAPTNIVDADHARYLQRVAKMNSRNLMSSGSIEPVADGGGSSNHSVFAAALLKGLQTIPADRFSALDLFTAYISSPVAGQSQQTPQYVPIQNSGHDGGDFVFIKKSSR